MRVRSSTKQPSSPTRQLPLRASGLHIHDAIPCKPSLQDEIKRKVAAYPKLNLYLKPAQIRSWAYRHPAAVCKTDWEILNRLAFLLTRDMENPFCKISHGKLANKLGVSRITIIRRLKWLRDVNALCWKNQTNAKGGKIANEFFFELDSSKPENRESDTSHVSSPCNTHVSDDTCYARVNTTLNESISTTREARNARSTQQNRGQRYGENKTARGKRQTPTSGNEIIAVIYCLDDSEFKFDEAFIDDFRPQWNEVDLRTLLVDLAKWYEEHPDNRTNLTVLRKDFENRFPQWIKTDKYKQTE